MIKNIVLDMGNVLVAWRPDELAAMAAPAREDALIVERAYFGGPLWIEKDRGTVDEDDVLENAKAQVPDHLHPALEYLRTHWRDWLHALPGASDFVKRAKAAGFNVYLLSNAGVEFPDVLRRFDFYESFDGMVVSAHEKLIKPDRRIYEALLNRYGLAADECLFVDDMMENVLGAQAAGMDAVRFDGDYEKLIGALAARGLVV